MIKYILYGDQTDCDLYYRKTIRGYDSETKAVAEASRRNKEINDLISATGDTCYYPPSYSPEYDGSYDEYLEDNKEEIEKCNNCPYRDIENGTCKNEHWRGDFFNYKVEKVEWDEEE